MAEKKDFPVFRVGIVTLSDKGYQGEREDKSGPKIKELLPAAEAIRAGSMAITKRAMLSRAVSAIRHRTLIINLPGSPKAVEESLGFVLDTLPHALGLLRGTDGECGRS